MAAQDKRGPRLGDAASLWNFTPAPGWTTEETLILKHALQHFGVGKWVQILDAGVLPGKVIQQLNGQTQRLVGKQSLAAYTGQCVNIDKIREDNLALKDVERKGGLVINSGPNPTSEMRKAWQAEAKAKYGLSKEEMEENGVKMRELAALHNAKEAPNANAAAAAAAGPAANAAPAEPALMTSDAAALDAGARVDLLVRLVSRARKLFERANDFPPEENESGQPKASTPQGKRADAGEVGLAENRQAKRVRV